MADKQRRANAQRGLDVFIQTELEKITACLASYGDRNIPQWLIDDFVELGEDPLNYWRRKSFRSNYAGRMR